MNAIVAHIRSILCPSAGFACAIGICRTLFAFDQQHQNNSFLIKGVTAPLWTLIHRHELISLIPGCNIWYFAYQGSVYRSYVRLNPWFNWGHECHRTYQFWWIYARLLRRPWQFSEVFSDALITFEMCILDMPCQLPLRLIYCIAVLTFETACLSYVLHGV